MPAIIPRPVVLTELPGTVSLAAGVALTAPPAIAALAREVLGVRDGAYPMAFSLANDAALGAEGYRLRVGEPGIEAAARDEAGLRWAMQTLRQLTSVDGTLPCVEITDRPRYAWRGSLLDVARWCHPLPFLYRYVDLLALHKLNTLHLHLTDDQGWRFEVLRYPRLTEVGAFRRESSAGHAREDRFDGIPHGGFYTQAELRDLVGYAARRGVRVMPEIDAPGHMQAAIAAYPELGNDPGRRLEVRTSWGISTHVLNVDDVAIGFVRDVLDELVDVFPFGVVHTGGDEVPPDEWAASPAAKARAAALGLSKVDHLLGWWTRELGAHLARLGRRIALWDEVIEHRPPEGATIFGWRGVERVAAGLAAGYDVVAAPYTHTYFDWAESDDSREPVAINGVLPLETVHGYDPGPVLGTQGQLWSEYLPRTELVEWRAFPRLAALAEVAWSGPGHPYSDFAARLIPHLRRLDALGVRYRPL
jgi:hexosaminidase